MIVFDADDIHDFLADMDINVQIIPQGKLASYETVDGKMEIAQLNEISARLFGGEAKFREAFTQLKAKLREARGDANTILVLHFIAGESTADGSFCAKLACAFVNAKLAESERTLHVRRLVEGRLDAHIGDVAHALTLGYRCTRPDWADDAFIYLQKASKFKVNREPLLGIFPEDTDIKFAAHIDRYCGNGSCSVWTPTVEDLLATDWLILPHDA